VVRFKGHIKVKVFVPNGLASTYFNNYNNGGDLLRSSSILLFFKGFFAYGSEVLLASRMSVSSGSRLDPTSVWDRAGF
jgi:hypothetical protein